MKSAIKVACVAAACVGLAAVVGRGQVEPGGAQGPVGAAAVVVMNQPPSPTKLEAMLATRGAVIVRGYTDVGAVQSDDGSGVGVTAVELTDASRGQKEYGLAVGIKQAGRSGTSLQTYIDYDEIDALSSAMDTLAKLDSTATQLAGYEGRFKTKGDLEVANFADNAGARMVLVKGMQIVPETGQVGFATVYFPLARFAELRQLVTASKQTLDKVRNAGR